MDGAFDTHGADWARHAASLRRLARSLVRSEGDADDLAQDALVAALVPARRAMAWQLTDGEGDAVVRERYWVTFQPGEVRTCFSCHGVNGQDQSGSPPPTNKPQALKTLLQHLKSQGAL